VEGAHAHTEVHPLGRRVEASTSVEPDQSSAGVVDVKTYLGVVLMRSSVRLVASSC
jgi:hypothetical protein